MKNNGIYLIMLFFLILTVPVSAQTDTSKNAASKTTQKTDAEKKKEEEKKKLEEKQKEADKKRADFIEKTMKYGNQKERKEAINFIPIIRDEARKKDLTSQLIVMLDGERDSTVIMKSIYVLQDLKSGEAIPTVVKFLNNNSEDVKIAAVYFLKNMDAKETAASVQEIFKKLDFTKDSNFTTAVIQTLAVFKVNTEYEFAIEKIKDNKTTNINRLELLLFLGNSGSKGAESFLLETFNDEDEDISVRAYSANALAKINATSAIKDLNNFLVAFDDYSYNKKKDYYTLNIYVITALVKLGDSGSYSRLYESLRSDNTTVRLKSIELLKDLKDKRSIDILKYKAEYDPNLKVQKAAKEALKEMGVDFEPENKDDKDIKNIVNTKNADANETEVPLND
ncbi:MAG: HEAT repeat domain-containing protein [Spirochaetes bacterium]|nr:HEAT repeat domain-containing protein [Spirochaetota bacterium]